jgi:hypothetical protein
MNGLKAIFAASIFLVSSTSLNETPVVTTPEQAIQIGQKACNPNGRKDAPNDLWQARHRPWREDVWDVWLATKDDPENRLAEVEVWSNGRAGQCTERVKSTG